MSSAAIVSGRILEYSSRRSSSSPRRTPSSTRDVPLPEAQLDRFLLRTAFGYPSREGEVDVLTRRIERASDDVELRPVIDRETLSRCSRRPNAFMLPSASASTASTSSPRRGRLRAPRSVRARAEASLSSSSPAAGPRYSGRDFVLPDDVKAIAVPGARTSPRAAPRAVGAADHGRGRRRRGAR